jgi:hypothetical protein
MLPHHPNHRIRKADHRSHERYSLAYEMVYLPVGYGLVPEFSRKPRNEHIGRTCRSLCSAPFECWMFLVGLHSARTSSAPARSASIFYPSPRSLEFNRTWPRETRKHGIPPQCPIPQLYSFFSIRYFGLIHDIMISTFPIVSTALSYMRNLFTHSFMPTSIHSSSKRSIA